MRFHSLPEDLLGSKVKIRLVLRLLAEKGPMSERELARVVGVSHTAVSRALKDLAEAHFISPLRVGTAMVWRVREDSYAHATVRDLAWFAKTPPLIDLRLEIRSALGAPGVRKAVLFGSVAEGTESAASDIDLLVVLNEGKYRRRVEEALASLAVRCAMRYGNRLSPMILTGQEARLPRHRTLVQRAQDGLGVVG